MSDSDSDVEFVPVRGTPAKRRSPRSINRVPIYTDQISDSDEELVPVRRTPAKRRNRRGVDLVPISNFLNTSQKISDSDEELVPVRRTPAKRRSRGGVDAVPVSNSINTSQKISDSDSEEDCITVPSQTISDSDEELVPVRRTPAKRRSRRVIDPVPVSNSINTSQKMPASDVEVNSDSDAEAAPVIAPPKRRRMIDPSAIAPVPIYSNKVFSCLNLNKMPATLVKNDTTAAVAKCADAAVLPVPTAQGDSSVYLTDSEDEEPQKVTAQPVNTIIHSPSPPPPIGSPATRSTRASRRKVSDMNRKLSALGSRLRTSPLKRARKPSTPSTPTAGCGLDEDEEEGDREVTLKFRWRSVLHKVTVPSSAPLSKAVEELSVKIKLPPSRILLLRKERELPTDSTANELGLGIADIIDCVIIQEENKEADENDDGMISIRIQNKERSAAQTYSLHRDAALGSVLRQYLSTTYPNAKRKPKVVFCFDGTTITTNQTPSQLDMEDGDVIDVWA